MTISSQKLVQNLRLQDEWNNELKAWINLESKLPHTLADDDKEWDQASMLPPLPHLLDSDTDTMPGNCICTGDTSSYAVSDTAFVSLSSICHLAKYQ